MSSSPAIANSRIATNSASKLSIVRCIGTIVASSCPSNGFIAASIAAPIIFNKPARIPAACEGVTGCACSKSFSANAYARHVPAEETTRAAAAAPTIPQCLTRVSGTAMCGLRPPTTTPTQDFGACEKPCTNPCINARTCVSASGGYNRSARAMDFRCTDSLITASQNDAL